MESKASVESILRDILKEFPDFGIMDQILPPTSPSQAPEMGYCIFGPLSRDPKERLPVMINEKGSIINPDLSIKIHMGDPGYFDVLRDTLSTIQNQ